MSENEIKPVAWVERNENGHDRMWSSTLESWANRPVNPEPLYDQAAIDRLSADAVGYKRIADEVAGMLESAEDLIDRLTAERDAYRLQAAHETDVAEVAAQEIERLKAERDAALADVKQLRSVINYALAQHCYGGHPRQNHWAAHAQNELAAMDAVRSEVQA